MDAFSHFVGRKIREWLRSHPYRGLNVENNFGTAERVANYKFHCVRIRDDDILLSCIKVSTTFCDM